MPRTLGLLACRLPSAKGRTFSGLSRLGPRRDGGLQCPASCRKSIRSAFTFSQPRLHLAGHCVAAACRLGKFRVQSLGGRACRLVVLGSSLTAFNASHRLRPSSIRARARPEHPLGCTCGRPSIQTTGPTSLTSRVADVASRSAVWELVEGSCPCVLCPSGCGLPTLTFKRAK